MLKTIIRSIRTNILVGLILITPIVVTLLVINAVVNFFRDSEAFENLLKFVPEELRTSVPEFIWLILHLAFLLAALFLIGVFARNIFGRQVYALGDRFIGRIPGINKIYLFVRTISESVVAQRETMFQEVVIAEYPRKGLHSIAFITATVPEQIGAPLQGEGEDEYVYLFIPTTPNPTSGFLIMSKRSELKTLDISPGDAMKLIISAGAASPGHHSGEGQHTLLDKVEHWIANRQHKSGRK